MAETVPPTPRSHRHGLTACRSPCACDEGEWMSAAAPAPSLQDGIDRAGSPVRLLWKPNAAPFKVPVIKPEYAGWREEQAAWRQGVTLADLSHHMSDLFLQGPDATRLLAAVSANDYEAFAV